MVVKKGKPLTMFNPDKSLKMTRENYFKVVEKQENNRMMDTLSSILSGRAQDQLNKTGRKSRLVEVQ